jgi:predicted lipoprotein with Yx(FWY)xxD motif
MDRFPRTAAILVLVLLLPCASVLVAGCSREEPLTVRITEHPTYGAILTDSTGRSLYIQARDVPNTGAVANLGEVGRFYPPFYAETVTDGNRINVSDFGYLTRADGTKQTTFRGWPLYYYINDRASGDVKSQGANNITFVAKPDYTVMVRENDTLGVYLTDVAGAPLVAAVEEAGAGPAAGLVPFRVTAVVAPSPLVQAADFGQARGPSGGMQTTYRGSPLYVSDEDTPAPGNGQGAGAYRAIFLAPAGALTGTAGDPTAAPTPTPTAGGNDNPATTAPTTTAAATTATPASGYDAYTGGVYTPTPFRTVQVVGYSTESATTTVTWTQIPSVATVSPVGSTPAVTTPPTTVAPATTVSAATTTRIATPRTTAARTTTAPPVVTTTPPTTLPTSAPITSASTVPVPFTTTATTTATTLPLPFPITTPNPAISTQAGNGS